MSPRLIFAIFDFTADEIHPEFGFAKRMILGFFRLLFVGVEKQPVGDERDVGLVPILIQLLLAVLVLGII